MSEEILELHLGSQALQSLLGYLNFAEGKPDVHFQKHLHDAYSALVQKGSAAPWADLQQAIRASLADLQRRGLPAFRDIHQAEAVLDLVFGQVMPAYRRHHRDLLFHLTD